MKKLVVLAVLALSGCSRLGDNKEQPYLMYVGETVDKCVFVLQPHTGGKNMVVRDQSKECSQ